MASNRLLRSILVEQELFCDSPLCGEKIKTRHVSYNARDREVYHIGDCTTIAIGNKELSSEYEDAITIDYISRDEALVFFLLGKLKSRWEN